MSARPSRLGDPAGARRRRRGCAGAGQRRRRRSASAPQSAPVRRADRPPGVGHAPGRAGARGGRPEEVLRGYEEALESLGFRPGLVEAASLALLSAAETDSARRPAARQLGRGLRLVRAHPRRPAAPPAHAARGRGAGRRRASRDEHPAVPPRPAGGGCWPTWWCARPRFRARRRRRSSGACSASLPGSSGRGRLSGWRSGAPRPRRWRVPRPASCGGRRDCPPQPRPPAVPERAAAHSGARRRVPGPRRGLRAPRAPGPRAAPGAGARRRERGGGHRERDRGAPGGVGRAARGRRVRGCARGVGGGEGARGPPDVLLDGPPRRAREGAAAGGEDRLDHSAGGVGAHGAGPHGGGSHRGGRAGPPPVAAVARGVRGGLPQGLERGARGRRHHVHRAVRAEGASGGRPPSEGRPLSGASR